MGRIAYVPFSVTTTTTCDLMECAPADDKPVKIRGFLVGQKTELTEAQEEVLDIRIARMTATVSSGSGGADPAEWCPDSADAVTCTLEVNNTTIATTSGSTFDMRFPCQVRNTPYEFWFPDERFAPKAKGTEFIFLRLATAPADSIDIWGWVCIEEE
jgi:hypothetical protein